MLELKSETLSEFQLRSDDAVTPFREAKKRQSRFSQQRIVLRDGATLLTCIC